jgi:hypothetical protein
VIARNAHSYFTQRTILTCWKAALEQKRRDAWIEGKRKANMRALFDRMSVHWLIRLIVRMDGGYCPERAGYSGRSEIPARK